MTRYTLLIRYFSIAAIFLGCASKDDRTTWRIYKGDEASTSYSALDQVNKTNVSALAVAWTFIPGDVPEGARYGKSECNPIVVDGVMYATSVRHRVYAINPENGKMIWSFDPFDGERGGGMYRGVTYWEDGEDKRILFTAGNHLFAIDARTGKPIDTFGTSGKVNLDIGPAGDSEKWVIPTSPGMIYEDLFILGSEVSELYGAAPGHVRAFNARTGKLEWTFHTIPQPGEKGYETWPADAWKYVGGANNWGGMSLDRKRGMVFIPTGSPTYDYYGADRKGQNLFGNSIVALDAKSGNYIWHFQAVHHDLWDYDLPAPPNLVTVERDGRKIDAVAQTSKMGFLFVLDRETGVPVFPVEERKVPASNIEGEEAWPTQPFPLKPEPYSSHDFTEEMITDISPGAHDSVLTMFREFRFEGMYTPPDEKGTFMMPGSRGGSEWGGAAYDPETSLLYINANESPEIAKVKKTIQDNDEIRTVYNQGKKLYANLCASCHEMDKRGQEPNNPSLLELEKRMSQEEALKKVRAGGGRMPAFASVVAGHEDEILAFLFELKKDKLAETSVDTTSIYLNTTAYGHFNYGRGIPSIKPPWGTLNAINLNTGEYAWKIPLGNIPELQKPGAPPTGTENWGGPMVTAGGLVFIAATRDKMFRAFDKENGSLLWETTLPGHGYASPATYSLNGRQYIVISVTASKEEPSGYIMAFALPDK